MNLINLERQKTEKKYKEQRNKCLSILKGTKTNYFNNLNPKFITDYKRFWSAVKPLFSDKSKAIIQ